MELLFTCCIYIPTAGSPFRIILLTDYADATRPRNYRAAYTANDPRVCHVHLF